MTRDLLLSLDLGTTSVRALVVGANGRALSRAQLPLRVAYPEPGRVEQDANDMWERSVEVLRAALAEAHVDIGRVAGIGVVNQRSACIAWDARTQLPLAPVIGWQDQRTAERVAGFRKLGVPLNTQASCTKLEWWMQNDDAVRKSAAAGTLRLGTPDTWLSSRLTGGTAHVTDPGNASCTGLLDNASGAWAGPLVELFSVPADALAEVVASNEIVGETPADLLGAAIPVAARAGDQQAATFGQGVHLAGQAKLTLGTSAMLDLCTGETLVDPAPDGAYPLSLWRLVDGSRAFCVEGTVLTAGSALEWAVELGLARDAREIDALAGSISSTEGVSFVPALQGLGTPYADDAARGLLCGLTRGSGRAQILRALLDGIAQRCVDVCDALQLGDEPLRVDGGLAQSATLLQMLADYGGRPLERAAEVEATALGAALLAGLSTGVFATRESWAAGLAAPTCFTPAMDAAERTASRERWADTIERARHN